MFSKRVMSGSARMSTGKLFQTTGRVLRRKMHVHQVWCELVVHNSLVSFLSEDFTTSLSLSLSLSLSVCVCVCVLTAIFQVNLG